MNDIRSQRLFERMKRESLTARERAAMREALVAHVRGYKPTYPELFSFRVQYYASRVPRKFSYALAALIIFVAAGGGISFAADGSLPGSILYPLKINVTEPVREALSFTEASKAMTDAEFAQRRLTEIADLSRESILTQPVKEWLLNQAAVRARSFSAHAANAGSSIDTGTAAEIASELEGSLNAHVELSERVATVTMPTLENLRLSAQDVSALRAEVEERVASSSEALFKEKSENQLKSAELDYADVQKLFDARPSHLPSAVASDTESDVNSIRQGLESGRTGIKEGSYTDAFQALLKARMDARSAKILLKVAPDDAGSRVVQMDATTTPSDWRERMRPHAPKSGSQNLSD